MTMVFRDGDAAMLEKLKAGDAIRFRATRDGAAMTVTEYLPARQWGPQASASSTISL